MNSGLVSLATQHKACTHNYSCMPYSYALVVMYLGQRVTPGLTYDSMLPALAFELHCLELLNGVAHPLCSVYSTLIADPCVWYACLEHQWHQRLLNEVCLCSLLYTPLSACFCSSP